jgi:hypothetical protein
MTVKITSPLCAIRIYTRVHAAWVLRRFHDVALARLDIGTRLANYASSILADMHAQPVRAFFDSVKPLVNFPFHTLFARVPC